MKTYKVKIEIELICNALDETTIDLELDEMDYDFIGTEKLTIVDSEIMSYEIVKEDE